VIDKLRQIRYLYQDGKQLGDPKGTSMLLGRYPRSHIKSSSSWRFQKPTRYPIQIN